jgi:hypothetical protein
VAVEENVANANKRNIDGRRPPLQKRA